MAGNVLRVVDLVTCSHQAPTSPPPVSGRVRIGGSPVVTTGAPYAVLGCPSTPTCTTGSWTLGATRVTTMGQALAIDSGVSTCVASASPLKVVSVQSRVQAT